MNICLLTFKVEVFEFCCILKITWEDLKTVMAMVLPLPIKSISGCGTQSSLLSYVTQESLMCSKTGKSVLGILIRHPCHYATLKGSFYEEMHLVSEFFPLTLNLFDQDTETENKLKS